MQAENCPWGPSPIKYDFVICEETLCSWIRQPANAWSNFGMLFVGLLLITRGFRSKSKTDLFSGCCIAFMGICSCGAHAFGSKLFGFLDVLSILVYLSLLVTIASLRSHLIAAKNFFLVWGGFSLLFISSQKVLPELKILMLAVVGLFLLISEGRFIKKYWNSVKLSQLLIAVGILIIAISLLALDYSKTYCSPENHLFQFHAAWHVLAAFSMYFITGYLQQFKLEIGK